MYPVGGAVDCWRGIFDGLNESGLSHLNLGVTLMKNDLLTGNEAAISSFGDFSC
jgi:hypothetical protein